MSTVTTPDVPTGPAAEAPAPAPTVAPPPATTGAASASQQQAPPPRDPRQPRKFAPAASSSNTGTPDLLRLVSTQPFFTIQKLATSTFIPTTVNFFLILAAMDAQMVFTHKFTQSNPHWHPLISQLYISLLIFIHIIRCMIEDNPTNMELINLYDLLYHHLGLESLIVPGPLVALFASITVSSSPHEWIGNVAPTLPFSTGATTANGYRLNNRIYMLLPSIPFILDQLHQLADDFARAATTPPTFNEANYNDTQKAFFAFFGAVPDNAQSARYNALTPNARYNTRVPFAAAQKFASLIPHLGLPSRLPTFDPASTTAEMNYLQFFGFQTYGTQTTSANWLTTIGPIMSTYSTFFQGSTSLLSISPTGLGSSLVVFRYQQQSLILPVNLNVTAATANPQLSAHVLRQQPNSNYSNAEHSDPDLSELAEQYASVSLVNTQFNEARRHNGTVYGPTSANVRTGPYWSLPTVRSALALNSAPGIPTSIATYYHSATPIRK